MAGAFSLLMACGGSPDPGPRATYQAPNPAANAVAPDQNRVVPSTVQISDSGTAYRLGSGDEVRVSVFGEENLSGEVEVDGQGGVSLPLIGHVRAAGMTLREFEDNVETALRDGYLRDPQVSVEVLNFRPYYIIGEINAGGEFPYSHGMTVLNAVAIAGGYSYRADQRKVYITRITNGREGESQALPSTTVMPGDVIRVPERFF